MGIVMPGSSGVAEPAIFAAGLRNPRHSESTENTDHRREATSTTSDLKQDKGAGVSESRFLSHSVGFVRAALPRSRFRSSPFGRFKDFRKRRAGRIHRTLRPLRGIAAEPQEPTACILLRMQSGPLSCRSEGQVGEPVEAQNALLIQKSTEVSLKIRPAQGKANSRTNMNHDAAEHKSLDQIAITLLEQLGCCGGVCPDSTPLPSVESVMTIVHDIRELLFPGVHGNRRLQPGAAAREYVASLTRIQSRLRIEISRALVHSRQVQLRLHNGVDAVSLAPSASALTDRFLSRLPMLQQMLSSDVDAAFNGDPAAKTPEEIVLCYPGIEAITVYRIAHELLILGVPYLPRIMTEWAHRETGIDIHPGSRIGEAFFVDHGTGVVIGETCEIGSNVTLYQGVTLGAWSFPRDDDGNLIRGTKRHPTLEDRVTVYSNATILGGTTVIGAGSHVGSSVTLSRSIPANTIVTIEKPSLRFREAA